MKRNRLLRTLPTLALLLALCLWLAVPGYAAEKSTKVRLADTDGTVTVTKPSGKTLTASKKLSLYTGYQVATGASSYAWISLDDSKAVKLDERSSVEIRSSDDGKQLEVLLLSGKLSTSVDKKLKSDEKMTVRTPNMVTGIRGTFLVSTTTEQYLLSGAADVVCRDPATGKTHVQPLSAGERVSYVGAETAAAGQAQGGAFVTEPVKEADVSGFVLTELAQNPQRTQEIFDASGVDLRGVTAEQAEARLAQDEQSSAARLAASQTVPVPVEAAAVPPPTEQVRQTPLWAGAPLVSVSNLLDGNKPAQPSAPARPSGSSVVSGGSDDSDDSTPTVYYTIQWFDGETLLGTTRVAAGTTPSYTAPKKAPDAEHSYVFYQWEPTIEPATKDASYTASYAPTEREYTLAFLDENGNTVKGGTFGNGRVLVKIDGEEAFPAQDTGLYTAHEGEDVSLTFTGQGGSVFGLEQLHVAEAKVDGNTIPLDTLMGSSPEGGGSASPISCRMLEGGQLQTLCSFTMPAEDVNATAVFSQAHRIVLGGFETPNQKLPDGCSALYRMEIKNSQIGSSQTGGELMHSRDNLDFLKLGSQDLSDLYVLSGETLYLYDVYDSAYVFVEAPSAAVNDDPAKGTALDPSGSYSGFELMIPQQRDNNADLVLSGTIMRQGDCVVTLENTLGSAVSVYLDGEYKVVFDDGGRFVFGANPTKPATIRLAPVSGTIAKLSPTSHDDTENQPLSLERTPDTNNYTLSVGDATHITLTVST